VRRSGRRCRARGLSKGGDAASSEGVGEIIVVLGVAIGRVGVVDEGRTRALRRRRRRERGRIGVPAKGKKSGCVDGFDGVAGTVNVVGDAVGLGPYDAARRGPAGGKLSTWEGGSLVVGQADEDSISGREGGFLTASVIPALHPVPVVVY